MSHTRLKTKYLEDTGFGYEIEKTLYLDINNSCDVVTILDDDKEHIFSFSEGDNNFADAFIRLMQNSPKEDKSIETW